MAAILSALLSYWTAGGTALQQDLKRILALSTVAKSCTSEKLVKNHSLVSALASSSNLPWRETFFFISNTCISSKPSAAQFSNVAPCMLLKSQYEIKHIYIFTIYVSSVMGILQFFFPPLLLCFSYCHCGFFWDELCLENPKLTSIFTRILCVPLIVSLVTQL